jgi:hypothetical protein
MEEEVYVFGVATLILLLGTAGQRDGPRFVPHPWDGQWFLPASMGGLRAAPVFW